MGLISPIKRYIERSTLYQQVNAMDNGHEAIWVVGVIYFVVFLPAVFFIANVFIFDSDYPPLRLIAAIFLPIFIAQRGLRRKSLSKSGAFSGIVLAFCSILCHWSFLTSLMAFYLSSSKMTKLGAEAKRRIEGPAFKEGGQRNWIQVFCNGGVALQICLFYALSAGLAGDAPLDFARLHSQTWWACAYLGAVACCNGDTWASEIGSWLSRGEPFLITTGKTVPRGTNGGVSYVGLVSSFLGGLVVGAAFWIGIYLAGNNPAEYGAPPQHNVILLGGISGLMGSLIDSYLGAVAQFSGWDPEQNCVVGKQKPGVRHISGRGILDNHLVNLFSSMLTAYITPYIALALF